ncbi:hypothetical protein VQ056_23520 [Paenibacillus sp. JTLBN-2024]
MAWRHRRRHVACLPRRNGPPAASAGAGGSGPGQVRRAIALLAAVESGRCRDGDRAGAQAAAPGSRGGAQAEPVLFAGASRPAVCADGQRRPAGDAYAAASWAEAGFRRDKYNAAEQTKSLEGLFKLARRKWMSGSAAEARRVLDTGLELYGDYARRAADPDQVRIRNDREFCLTREAEQWGRELASLERSLPAPE